MNGTKWGWTTSGRAWWGTFFLKFSETRFSFQEIWRNMKKYEYIWENAIFSENEILSAPKWPWLSSDPSNMYPDITFLQETRARAFTDTIYNCVSRGQCAIIQRVQVITHRATGRVRAARCETQNLKRPSLAREWAAAPVRISRLQSLKEEENNDAEEEDIDDDEEVKSDVPLKQSKSHATADIFSKFLYLLKWLRIRRNSS